MPPRVPVTPQVQEQIRPGYRLDAAAPQGAFGGGSPLAHNVAQANQTIDLERHRIQAERDAQKLISSNDAIKAMGELKAYENSLDYRSVLGDNTQGLTDRMKSAYQGKVDEISKNLKDQKAQEIFKEKANLNGSYFLESVNQHAGGQQRHAFAQRNDALVAQWQTAGIKAGASGNLAEMDRSAREIEGLRLFLSGTNGIPQEAVDRMIAQDTSKVYAGAIRSMLDTGKDLDAKAALAKYGDKLLPGDKATLDRMVQSESTLGEAYRQLDEITKPTRLADGIIGSQGVQVVNTPASEAEALSRTKGIKDPQVRRATESLVRQWWADQERSAVDAKKKLMHDAVNIIDSGKKFDELPASMRDSMTDTERKRLRVYSAGEVQTDEQVRYDLRLEAAYPETRERFKKLDLMQYADKLSKSDREEMEKLQAGLIKEDAQAVADADGYRTVNSIITGTVGRALKGKDKEAFSRLMDEEIKAWKIANNKKVVPPKEVEQMVDNLLKYKDPDAWIFKGKRGYETLPEQRAKEAEAMQGRRDAAINKISEEDWNVIWKALEGQVITDDKVLKLYDAMLIDRAKKSGK